MAPDHETPYRWSVAIFSTREDVDTLRTTVDAVLTATEGARTLVDVVVNGNPRLATQLARALEDVPSGALRIWDVALRDKANAWNQYVHLLWPRADHAFFVDGYAWVAPDAFARLSDRLAGAPAALAAAAVPSVGRSAARLRGAMLSAPQINGSLYTLRGETLARVRASAFRVPLGMYRVDALLGSALCYNLGNATEGWGDDRVAVAADATWVRRAESPWNPRDVAAHLQRFFRQAIGRFEEQAIRDHLESPHPASTDLPETSWDLIGSWARRHPRAALAALAGHPAALFAIAALRQRSDWGRSTLPPAKVFSQNIDAVAVQPCSVA